MILNEFSKYLQKHNDDLINGKTSATKLLCEWIKLVINKPPKTNAEKIVHKEIMLAQNKSGDFLIVGKSDSGRILVRESGTEPLIRVMAEAETEELCRGYVDGIVDVILGKGYSVG